MNDNEPDNPRVSLVRMEPDCLVPGIRLRAKQHEFQPVDKATGFNLGIGDAWIREVQNLPDKGPRYICQTFVWRNEMTLTFEELIDIFCEATLPKGSGEQLYNLLFPLET